MEQQIYKSGFYKTKFDTYLEVFDCQDGYGYLLYDSKQTELDGGVLETQDWLEEDWVVREALKLAGYEDVGYEKIDTIDSLQQMKISEPNHTNRRKRVRKKR